MAQLEIDHIRLSFPARAGGRFVALDDVTLHAREGELVAIVGPSGCGKTSLLLIVNGLLKADDGEVCIDGRPVTKPGAASAMVFQEFALLPWRTARQNVELGLEVRGLSRGARVDRARASLQVVGLAGFENHYPHQLSGGMRQRVGLARALSVDPGVLLLDEPFGALDAQTRFLMGRELLEIWERQRSTILLVTHDIDEAVYLADRVLVMSARPGRILDALAIDLPRPRDLEVRNSPRFADYRRHIWAQLEHEVQSAEAGLARGGLRAGG